MFSITCSHSCLDTDDERASVNMCVSDKQSSSCHWIVSRFSWESSCWLNRWRMSSCTNWSSRIHSNLCETNIDLIIISNSEESEKKNLGTTTDFEINFLLIITFTVIKYLLLLDDIFCKITSVISISQIDSKNHCQRRNNQNNEWNKPWKMHRICQQFKSGLGSRI